MTDLCVEGNGSIYINQRLILLLQNLGMIEQKATQHGKNLQLVCSIKIKIHEHGDSVLVTHTDDFTS